MRLGAFPLRFVSAAFSLSHSCLIRDFCGSRNLSPRPFLALYIGALVVDPVDEMHVFRSPSDVIFLSQRFFQFFTPVFEQEFSFLPGSSSLPFCTPFCRHPGTRLFRLADSGLVRFSPKDRWFLQFLHQERSLRTPPEQISQPSRPTCRPTFCFPSYRGVTAV